MDKDGNVVIQESLPPVEYLIIEVLGARKRLGETHWTFPSKLNSWLNSLAKKGLLNWQAGIVEQTSRAWLTQAGEQCWLSEEYLLTRKHRDCGHSTTTDILERVGNQLQERYGPAERECNAADCNVLYIPSKAGKVYCSERCRQRVSNQAEKGSFSPEMEAELLADAKAGNIRAWHE